LSTINPTKNGLKLNPFFSGKRTAINRMIHGMTHTPSPCFKPIFALMPLANVNILICALLIFSLMTFVRVRSTKLAAFY
jgi:hypothetical protein